MIWRWLADWCVPAKALRWGHHPPLTLAQADKMLQEHYSKPLRDFYNERKHPWST